MPNKYYEAISNIKMDEERKKEILEKLKEEKSKGNKGVTFMNKIRKMWMTIGAIAGIAAFGGLAYAGITANKPHVEDSGIAFSDNYNEYEYVFDSQVVESEGTTIKLESAMCNEGFTVLKFDVMLSDEIKQHADETCGLIYLSYNDEIEKDNSFPRLAGANYNLIINGKKQWLRLRYDRELKENIINKNYTDYELYLLTDEMLENKNKFTVTLKDFRLNVGEKLYEIPGIMEFELDKEKAVKSTTEFEGNNETLRYKSLEEKVEKVIQTPLQTLIRIKDEISSIIFNLTDDEYVGDISYDVFDQNGNKLISRDFDIDLKYIHKNGTEEQGDIEDGKDDYSDIAKIIYGKYLVVEKGNEITSLNIKVYSTNEYYGTRTEIGEYNIDLKNKNIVSKNVTENIYKEIVTATKQDYIGLLDIQDFDINLNPENVSVAKDKYTIGYIEKEVEVVGYSFVIDGDFFTIVVMNKDKDYIFLENNKELEQIKLKENNTKKAILLNENMNSYYKYKDIVDSIVLK